MLPRACFIYDDSTECKYIKALAGLSHATKSYQFACPIFVNAPELEDEEVDCKRETDHTGPHVGWTKKGQVVMWKGRK